MVREEVGEGQLLHTPNSNPGTQSAFFIYQGRVRHRHNNSMV